MQGRAWAKVRSKAPHNGVSYSYRIQESNRFDSTKISIPRQRCRHFAKSHAKTILFAESASLKCPLKLTSRTSRVLIYSLGTRERVRFLRSFVYIFFSTFLLYFLNIFIFRHGPCKNGKRSIFGRPPTPREVPHLGPQHVVSASKKRSVFWLFESTPVDYPFVINSN